MRPSRRRCCADRVEKLRTALLGIAAAGAGLRCQFAGGRDRVAGPAGDLEHLRERRPRKRLVRVRAAELVGHPLASDGVSGREVRVGKITP